MTNNDKKPWIELLQSADHPAWNELKCDEWIYRTFPAEMCSRYSGDSKSSQLLRIVYELARDPDSEVSQPNMSCHFQEGPYGEFYINEAEFTADMGEDALRTLKAEQVKCKIRDQMEFVTAKGQYINILHGLLGDSVLARIETNGEYDTMMFHSTDANKSPQRFLQMIIKAASDCGGGTDAIAIINKKLTRNRDFEAVVQTAEQPNIATFIRQYKNAMKAAKVTYTEQEQIQDVVRRMLDKELYTNCTKGTVSYPTSWEELISIAPRFASVEKMRQNGRDHIFVAAEHQTVRTPGPNKEGRLDKVEQSMWEKLTLAQQNDYKAKRRAQYKFDREKKAATDNTTDKTMLTNGEYSTADWETADDGDQVMMTMEGDEEVVMDMPSQNVKRSSSSSCTRTGNAMQPTSAYDQRRLYYAVIYNGEAGPYAVIYVCTSWNFARQYVDRISNVQHWRAFSLAEAIERLKRERQSASHILGEVSDSIDVIEQWDDYRPSQWTELFCQSAPCTESPQCAIAPTEDHEPTLSYIPTQPSKSSRTFGYSWYMNFILGTLIALIWAISLANGLQHTRPTPCEQTAAWRGDDSMPQAEIETILAVTTLSNPFAAMNVVYDVGSGIHVCKSTSLGKTPKKCQTRYIAGIKRNDTNALSYDTRCRFLSPLLGDVPLCVGATANIISQGLAKDQGFNVHFCNHSDKYTLTHPLDKSLRYEFGRMIVNGRPLRHYIMDSRTMRTPDPNAPFNSVLGPTRSEMQTTRSNSQKYTVREVNAAKHAMSFINSMGGPPIQAAISQLASMKNPPVTTSDLRRAIDIWGVPTADIKSRTTRHAVNPSKEVRAPIPIQAEQTMQVDLFFIKKRVFLCSILLPLDYAFVVPLPDKSGPTIAAALKGCMAKTSSRGFDVRYLRCDNEKGIQSSDTVKEVQECGVELDFCGAGEHCPEVERRIRWIKEKYRRLELLLPFIMTSTLIDWGARAAGRFTNLQRTSSSMTSASPRDKFLGRPFDFRIDARVSFGTYVQCTVRSTDNTPTARTEGCIALIPTDNMTGSIYFYHVLTRKVVIRDQFTALPTPDALIERMDTLATKQGYSRGQEPFHSNEWEAPDDLTPESNEAHLPAEPTFIPEQRSVEDDTRIEEETARQIDANDQGNDNALDYLTVEGNETAGDNSQVYESDQNRRYPARERIRNVTLSDAVYAERGGARLADAALITTFDTALSRHMIHRKDWRDKDYAFVTSVKAALRERGTEATVVMEKELRQFVTKNVFHPVLMRGLSRQQRMRILPSKMFLKEKYFPNGDFDKLKARLVAGGHRQDRSLYREEDTSSPTAAQCSVMSVCAIAASEGRQVACCDIGGAFLNANMPKDGVKVLVRIDRTLSEMLINMFPDDYKSFATETGELVVELDRAMYGCVEAAKLWFDTIRNKLLDMGFTQNDYDLCVFNRVKNDGPQCTIVLHVDDMLITCEDAGVISSVIGDILKSYPDTKYQLGPILPYLGMDLDFSTEGEVRITMDGMVNDILAKSGVTGTAPTPATETLFEVDPSCPPADKDEAIWFHQNAAKLLYLCKRVRPECLTTVAFLSTRVTKADKDDLGKLKRVLRYLSGTKGRGVCLRPGQLGVRVRAYIDAAYGVHEDGKSHTGCAIVIGEAGATFVLSGKQSIVTKSSTEAEMVATSDSCSQAFHVRNFIVAQGHDDKPAEILQDNLSCMALLKKGRSTAMRTRHIKIRYFWVTDRLKQGEGVMLHVSTEDMGPANILTKPVQGAQFVKERQALTNWD